MKADKGPEIVIILPLKTSGWLEQFTMDLLRNRLLVLFQLADHQERLRVYYPKIEKDDKETLYVHSKLFIIDDNILKVGSSNLSNRSMSLDSECDLVITANDDSHISKTIKELRHKLISEHLGILPEEYRDKEKQTESMISAIQSFRYNKNNHRKLNVLENSMNREEVKIITPMKIVDPEIPIDPDNLIDYFIGKPNRTRLYSNFYKFIFILILLIIFTAFWTHLPSNDWLNINHTSIFNQEPANPILIYSIYTVPLLLLSIFGMPATIIVGTFGILFGSITGSILAVITLTVSSLISYPIGRILGKKILSYISSGNINSVNKYLAKKGLFTVITIRVLPIASFTLINMLAGASRIRFKYYLIGTILGILPGSILVAIIFGQLTEYFKSETIVNTIWITTLTVMIIICLIGISKYFSKYFQNKKDFR
ncbi:MAG: VTT domain-containing protein [Calditrichaceae bacterium]